MSRIRFFSSHQETGLESFFFPAPPADPILPRRNHTLALRFVRRLFSPQPPPRVCAFYHSFDCENPPFWSLRLLRLCLPRLSLYLPLMLATLKALLTLPSNQIWPDFCRLLSVTISPLPPPFGWRDVVPPVFCGGARRYRRFFFSRGLRLSTASDLPHKRSADPPPTKSSSARFTHCVLPFYRKTSQDPSGLNESMHGCSRT